MSYEINQVSIPVDGKISFGYTVTTCGDNVIGVYAPSRILNIYID